MILHQRRARVPAQSLPNPRDPKCKYTKHLVLLESASRKFTRSTEKLSYLAVVLHYTVLGVSKTKARGIIAQESLPRVDMLYASLSVSGKQDDGWMICSSV